MAAVSKRKRKVGVDEHGAAVYVNAGWQVRYVDPMGAERRRSFEKQRDAQRFAAEVETQKARGTYVDAAAGKETFKEYAERWRKAQHGHRPRTQKRWERILRLHVYPSIGHKPIAQIRFTDLSAMVKTWGGAESTRAKLVKDVRAVFHAAVLDRVIAVSPAEALKIVRREPDDEVVPFEQAEIDALRSGLPERYRLIVDLGIGAGLRIGEVLGLRIADINFLRREVNVEVQWPADPLKTKASYRTIPVPDVLLERASAHIAAHCRAGADPLFATSTGAQLSPAYWSQFWTASVAAAKMAKGTRFHRMRHTYASALIHGGCQIKELQARLGHATAKETWDTYGHLWPNSEDRTREAAGALFDAGSAPDRPSTLGITP
jgi:integrase